MDDLRIKVPPLSELRSHRSAKWRGFEPDVLPLPVAEMDFPIAQPIVQLLHDMISNSETGYLGNIPELGEAFSRFTTSRWQWKSDPLQVRLTADVGIAAVEILRVICKPGDTVLINSPVYQNFKTWIAEAKMNTMDVPFILENVISSVEVNPWVLDWPSIEKAYASGIKVHLICSPHNPLGFVYSHQDLERIANLAKIHGVIVISDEIHAPLTYKEKEFVPFLSVSAQARETGVCITAASKGWNLAGLKCALIVTEDTGMDKRMTELPPSLHFSTSILGAFAATAAFESGEEWLNSAISTLDDNRILLGNLLATHLPSVGYHLPHNGYLAWLNLEALQLGTDPSLHLLEKGKVAFNAGHLYSPVTPHYIRLNFATSGSIITEAIDRIVSSVG